MIGQNAWASAHPTYAQRSRATECNAAQRLVKEREKKKRRKRDAEDAEVHQKSADYEGDEDSRTATFRNKKLKLSGNTNTLRKKAPREKRQGRRKRINTLGLLLRMRRTKPNMTQRPLLLISQPITIIFPN